MQPPVLLLIYNRPDLTRRTVNRLVELGVNELHVSADGPKNDADRLRCKEARACLEVNGLRVERHFSETHRGCRDGVMHGVNWFFGQVEEGIIVEDDCLATEAFIQFAAELLNRHRNDRAIYMISGNNPIGHWESGHSHHFARIGHVWGWATWRDRWHDFDPRLPQLRSFSDHEGFVRLWGNTGLPKRIEKNANDALHGKVDTWDFQWTLHHAMQGRLAAIPCENLVENIGLGSDATHTDQRPEWISNRICAETLTLTAPSEQPDCEYELSLYAARALNTVSLPSSCSFGIKCKGAEKALRIVQVNTTDIAGGAEAVMLQHHRALKDRGFHSTILIQKRFSQTDDIVEMMSNPLTQIKGVKPDIVHLHNIHGTGLSMDAVAELANEIPVIWTLHDAWVTTGSDAHPFLYSPKGLSFLDSEAWHDRLNRRKALLLSDNIRLTAPSQWLRGRVCDIMGVACHFVPNSIPLQALEEVPQLDRPFILFVANHAERNRYRDLPTLRSAWVKANACLGEQTIDLLCIGGVPAEEKVGNSFFRMVGRSDSQKVLGLMRNAMALVQASLQDNAPLTVLEAHSVGAPVIGSMVGGIPEMMCPEEAELLYPASDADALAASIVSAVVGNARLRGAVERSFLSTPLKNDMTDICIGHYLEMLHA
ncbi:MAG: glycosyltransferase [Flavobacteriales bacterium]|nr:glycosyltransferase [Flavobacteriales bacterium]